MTYLKKGKLNKSNKFKRKLKATRIASTKKRTQSAVWIRRRASQSIRTGKIAHHNKKKCEKFILILQVGFCNHFKLHPFVTFQSLQEIYLESSWEIQSPINLQQSIKLQLQKIKRKFLERNQKPVKHAVHVLTPREFVMNGMEINVPNYV